MEWNTVLVLKINILELVEPAVVSNMLFLVSSPKYAETINLT